MPTDSERLDFLNSVGRVCKFSDGWNAWHSGNRAAMHVKKDIRDAIDCAMQEFENDELDKKREELRKAGLIV